MIQTKPDLIKKELLKSSSKEKAEFLPRFFKAGPGGYAEGDVFIGTTVPKCREVAKKYKNTTPRNLKVLLKSKIHEERLVALLILVEQFKSGSVVTKENIYKFYLSNTKYINNWDLVDSSAPKIVGEELFNYPHYITHFKGKDFEGTEILTILSKSASLWERRIAIIATFTFIKNGQLTETLRISKLLLADKHDLIHKAVGWMLREVGKKDRSKLENFLKENYMLIPRTTLRYAIERFPEELKKEFLSGKF